MARFYDLTNALDKKVFPKKKDGFKGEWQRTKFTMKVNEMKTPKLDYNSTKGKIVLGFPKDSVKPTK